MKQIFPIGSAPVVAALIFLAAAPCPAQQALTWDQVKAKFEISNPALKADADNIDEMKAEEITAYFRPNPQFTLLADGTQIAPHAGAWTPLKGTYEQPNFSYLHEREHKRELRLESAKEGTRITASEHEDLKRNMVFTLRAAFVETLEAKAVLELARADLEYYDNIIAISRDRFKAGDLAQIDLDRIELLRVQYEVGDSDRHRQPAHRENPAPATVERSHAGGAVRCNRPLRFLRHASARSMIFARWRSMRGPTCRRRCRPFSSLRPTTSWPSPTVPPIRPSAAGTPTIPRINNPNGIQTLGVSVSVPLRIFDRNQGEKQRTLIDIDRSHQATEAARAQVFSDVDSAYAQVESNIELLKPYKAKYKDQALRVRDTVTYAYEHGGASLMDFLNAQSDYRQVQLAYAQLIGAYLTAAGQLNLAVGREVIQ